MKQTGIRLFYKNTTSEVIGAEDGITERQFKELAGKTSRIVKQVNEERQKRRLPYRDLPKNGRGVEKVKALTGRLKDGCENLVVLGIGGSALGNIALQTALNPYMYNIDQKQRRGPRLFVFDNVDPQQLGSFLDWAEDRLDKTIFNVISKSGRTAETAAQFMIVRERLLARFGGRGLKEHIVATTDPKEGALRRVAEETGIACLDVPEGVGGRFSVLSAVGLFSASMCGIDIEKILEGAGDMDERVSREDFYGNPAAINAAIHYHYYNCSKRISVMMPYSFALKDMADWYRQLWAESLGKAKDLAGKDVHIGPTPIRALGATDQHSQVQLYREGPGDKVFTFLQVEDFGRELKTGSALKGEEGYLADKDIGRLLNNEKRATEYALLKDKRPCITILFPRVDEYCVGQFIYLYEVTTSFAGALFGINAYDQPAVELGKEATFALMGREGEYREGLSYKKFAEQINSLTQIDDKFLV